MDTTQSTYKVWLLLAVLVMGFVLALQTLGSLFAGQTEVTDLKSAGEVVFIKSLEDFDRYLKSGNFIVGYFSSATCGPCKEFHDTYYAMAKEYNDVLFLDVCHGTFEGSETLLTKYNICSFPTFIFFDKTGAKKESFSGINERTKAKIAGEIVMLKEGKVKSNITYASPQPQQPVQKPKPKTQPAPRPQPKSVPQTKPMPKNSVQKPAQPVMQQQAQPIMQPKPVQPAPQQQPAQQPASSISMQQAAPQQSMRMVQNVPQAMSTPMQQANMATNNAVARSVAPQAMSPSLQQTGIIRTNALPQSVPQQAMHTYQSSQGAVTRQNARAQRSMRMNQRNGTTTRGTRRLGRRRRQWALNAEYQ